MTFCGSWNNAPAFGADHREVVVRITGGDHLVVQRAEHPADRRMIVDTGDVVDDAVVLYSQLMTQDRGAAELLHQRRSELLERIAQQDHLVLVEALEELVGAVDGPISASTSRRSPL